MITKKEVFESLTILAAQCGHAGIRKTHKGVLTAFIKQCPDEIKCSRLSYEMDEYADLEKATKQGSVSIPYGDLGELMGEPNFESGDKDKVRAEWRLSINGVGVAIYDWKTNGIPLREVDVWNVGAKSPTAMFDVRVIISEGVKPLRTQTTHTINCENCKHYKIWEEYGEQFGDCYYNDLDHAKWYMDEVSRLDEENKPVTKAAEKCPHYVETIIEGEKQCALKNGNRKQN